tara:strand:+ start:31 stop:396 length:366 start_codon:yes stop_codon:yes gene_type:complete
MHQIKSNPVKTILVIITGLLVFYLFKKLDIILYIILSLGLIGVFSSYLSSKVELLWFKIAYFLSLIIPNIILGFIFYFFLFPIALFSRVFSKDPLNLKNSSRSIYKEVNKNFNKDSFKNTW